MRIVQTEVGQKVRIGGFRIVYWLPLAGAVSEKMAKTRRFADAYKYTDYFIRVGGTQVGVSQEDYRVIREGQKVRVEFTIDGSPARIVRIDGKRRWRPSYVAALYAQ